MSGIDRREKIWSVIRVASGNFLEMYDFFVFGYYAVAAAIFLLAVGIGGHIFFAISTDRFSPSSFRAMDSFAANLNRQADPA